MARKGPCSDARSRSVQHVDKRKEIHGPEVIAEYTRKTDAMDFQVVTSAENQQSGGGNVFLSLKCVSCEQFHRVLCCAKVKTTNKIPSLDV
jgi:hypothetical protein